jgi:hypothetical protein
LVQKRVFFRHTAPLHRLHQRLLQNIYSLIFICYYYIILRYVV